MYVTPEPCEVVLRTMVAYAALLGEVAVSVTAA
jgi:hypothetical protein